MKKCYRVSPEDYRAVLLEFVRLSKDSNTKILILNLPFMNVGDPTRYYEHLPHLEKYYRIATQVAAENGVPLIDFHRLWTRQQPEMYIGLMRDRIHLNEYGSELVASEIVRTILENHLLPTDP